MREEFENSPRFKGMDFTRAPGHPDYYESPYANGAWDGWKASRESLVIELPKIINKDWACDSSECEFMRGGINLAKLFDIGCWREGEAMKPQTQLYICTGMIGFAIGVFCVLITLAVQS